LFLSVANIRRLPITLLEVIIVIAILSLASGIVAVSINKALVEQRFRTEVEKIVDEMRLAQDLMLILGTDVHVHFAEHKSGKGIVYWLDLETTLPENLKYEILREKPKLQTIKGVFLADELVTEVKEKHIDVKFLSNGSVMSKGIMRLATSDDERVPKGTLESFICLAGYPQPIFSRDSKEEAEKLCQKFEEGLDERLTQDTMQRLSEKLKQPEVPPNSDTSKKDHLDNLKGHSLITQLPESR